MRPVPYDHPDATALIDEVQREYVRRYGEKDVSPVDPAQFSPPRGLFLVGYLGDRPVASGGWRVRDADPDLVDGDVEVKRMYVVPAARGRGLARMVLAELEHTARAAGHLRVMLETGVRQPEAIALYRSCGYTRVPSFGTYKDSPDSVFLGKRLRPAGNEFDEEDQWLSTRSAT